MKTSAVSARGEEFTLRTCTAGEVLGELCLCEGVRQDEATALESIRVVEIPLPALLNELQRDLEAALELISSILRAAGSGLCPAPQCLGQPRWCSDCPRHS